MEKIEIKKNGIPTTVATIDNIGGSEHVIIGDYQRNLLFRTKGSVRIQVGNKFYDLTSNDISNTNINDIIILENGIDTLGNIPADGTFVYTKNPKGLYVVIDGIPEPIISATESALHYISYLVRQELSGENIRLAQSNIGFLFPDLNNFVLNAWDNKIGFVESEQNFNIILNGEAVPLFVRHHYGGVIRNGLIISDSIPMSTPVHALMHIDSLWQENQIRDKYLGLYIGDKDYNGVGFHYDGVSAVAQYSNRFDFKYNDDSEPILSLEDNAIYMGDNSSSFLLSVNGTTSSKDFIFSNKLTSRDAISVIDTVNYYNLGDKGIYAAFEYDSGWTLQADTIIETTKREKRSIAGLKAQRILSTDVRVLALEVLDEALKEVSIDTDIFDIAVNDRILVIGYDENNYSTSLVKGLVKTVDIPDVEDEEKQLRLTITNEFDNYDYLGYNKISLIVLNRDNVLLDTITNSVIGYNALSNYHLNKSSNVDLLAALDSHEENIHLTLPNSNIHSVLGKLTGISNPDLPGITGNGLYSNNAFIKGKADLNYLKLGDQLFYNGSTLVIADLETLKNRRVDGSNGLTGGGRLFDANIVISHANGSWATKSNLTGAQFISNLSVDVYGHLTDWTVRNVTTSDIPEGTNLYYTDARVKALFPNYTLLTSITQANVDNWSTGYNNSLTSASFNETTNTLTLTRPSGNLTVVIPSGGISDLSLGPLTTTTMPILNSAGTGVTLVAATDTTAGLITADTTTTQELAGNKSLSGILTLNQAPLLSYSELRMLGPNNYIRTNNLSNMSINANSGIFFQIAGSTTASIFADYLKIDKYIKMTGPTGWQGGIMFETSPGVDAGVIVASGTNDMWIRNGSNGGIVKIGDTYHSNQKVLLEGPIYLNSQQGSGVRMVTVAANGLLSSQPITSGGSWGSITGSIYNQTDLANELNAREPAFSKGSILSGAGISVTNGSSKVVGASNVTISISPATMTSYGGMKLYGGAIQTEPAQGTTSTVGRTYGVQFNSDGQAVVNVPWVSGGGGTNAVWGSITGSLTSQTDLNNALNSKEPAFSKGSIIQGAGVIISGNLTGRLVGSGDITITATGGGGSSQNLQQTTDIGNQTSNFIKITDSGNAPTGNGLYFNYEASNIAGVISVNRNGSSNPSRIELRDSSIKFFPYSGSTPVLSLDTTAVASAAFAGRVSGASAILNNEFVTRKQNHVFATSDYSENAITPSVNNTNMLYSLLNANNTIVLNNPTGTIDSSKMIIRVRSNATRSISWGSMYRGIGIVLPTTLPANKLMYVGFTGNTTDNKWDVIALQIES